MNMPFPISPSAAWSGACGRAATSSWRSTLHKIVESYLIISFIVSCAMVAAVNHLFTTSIWYDEALTLLTVSGHAQTDFTTGVDPFRPTANLAKIALELYQQDVHPPLYFWTLALWRMAFGESLEAARALSALFIAGTLLLLYRLAREQGMRQPWIPPAVFAVSGVGLQYAYNARPYAMAAFLIISTFLLAHRRSRWTGICGAAAIATHYFAALCIAPILAVHCWNEWKRNRQWVWATVGSFVIGVAPLLPLLRVHLTARPHQFPGFGPVRNEAYALLKGAMATSLPNSWLPGWGFALLTAAGIIFAGIWWCWRQRRNAATFVYLGFLLGFFLLALATNKSIAKMPDDYYLGIAAPVLALLAGFGLQAFPRVTPLLALLIVAGMATANPIINSTNYRAIAGRINAQCNDCTVVVGNGYAGAVPACMLYETKRRNVLVLSAGETPIEVLARAGTDEPLLFVKTNEPPTVAAEDRFVASYPAIWKDGYFEIYPHGAPKQGPESNSAGIGGVSPATSDSARNRVRR